MEELECDLDVEFVPLPAEAEAAWWAMLRILVAIADEMFSHS